MSYQVIPVVDAIKAKLVASAMEGGIVDSDSRAPVWDNTSHTQGLRFANDGKTILIARSTIAPTHSYATWSVTQKQAGSYSALLTKLGTDGDRSTHLQIVPTAGLTLNDLQEAITDATPEWSFYHYLASGDGVQNGPQFEFLFEDPDSHGWLEVTCVGLQGYTGTDAWVKEALAGATLCGFGGQTPDGSSVFEWGPLTALTGLLAAVNAAWDTAESGEVATNYLLERVRVELWELAARTAYIDTIVLDGVAYAVEPGLAGAKLGNAAQSGNTPSVTLAFVEVRDKYGRTESLAPIVGAEQSLIIGPFLPELFNDDDGYAKFKPDTTGLTVRYSAVRVV